MCAGIEKKQHNSSKNFALKDRTILTVMYFWLALPIILPIFFPDDTKNHLLCVICSAHVTFIMFGIENGIQMNEW